MRTCASPSVPLRHHVLHKEFIDDIVAFLATGVVPPQRLELRIAEKAFIARPATDFDALARLGVRLVIDEVGRGMASLDWLARARIWGLQLDRAWVTAFRSDPAALKVCSAGIAVANALQTDPDCHWGGRSATARCAAGTGLPPGYR